MEVTAIITSFWEERTDNIDPIIRALGKSYRKPDKIILINNNDKYFVHKKNVTTINCSENFHARARFPIALLAKSDYYLFQDDDLMVRSRTLENFLKHADWGCALTLFGRDYERKTGVSAEDREKYTDFKLIDGQQVKGARKVSVPLRIYLLHREAIIRYLDREAKNIEAGTEDLFVGFSNLCRVIPAKEHSEFVTELPTGGVGYSQELRDLRDDVAVELF